MRYSTAADSTLGTPTACSGSSWRTSATRRDQLAHHDVGGAPYDLRRRVLDVADEGTDVDRGADHDVDPRAQEEVLEQAQHHPLAADDLVGADHRHGDDRRSGLQGEPDGTRLGPLRPLVRIAGDPSFREHADRFAGVEGGGRGVEGVCRVRAAAGDGDESKTSEGATEDGHTEHARRSEQAQRPTEPAAGERQQDSVGVARVVGDDDDRPVGQALGRQPPAALPFDRQPADGGDGDAEDGSERGVQQRTGAAWMAPAGAHWCTMTA